MIVRVRIWNCLSDFRSTFGIYKIVFNIPVFRVDVHLFFYFHVQHIMCMHSRSILQCKCTPVECRKKYKSNCVCVCVQRIVGDDEKAPNNRFAIFAITYLFNTEICNGNAVHTVHFNNFSRRNWTKFISNKTLKCLFNFIIFSLARSFSILSNF